MKRRIGYVDSSAYAKVFMAEPESAALRKVLRGLDVVASSALLQTEVVRALRRVDPELASEALAETSNLDLIALDDDILQAAGLAAPSSLRTLDAIHLASALNLGRRLHAFITYDRRLGDAARDAGLPVLSPS